LIAPSGVPHPKWWYPIKEKAPLLVQRIVSWVLRRFFASRDYRQAGQLLPVFKNVVKEDCRPVFRKINQSTLIIWGKDDQELPLADGEKIHQLIKFSQLKIVEGGHFPFWQDPKRVAGLIDQFIKKEK